MKDSVITLSDKLTPYIYTMKDDKVCEEFEIETKEEIYSQDITKVQKLCFHHRFQN